MSFALCISSACSLYAQNGWDDIRKNDHKLARTHFTAALGKDSTDISSLEGMIFLSEVEGDDLSYNKYANSLINNHWNEYIFELLEDNYSIKDEKDLLNKPGLSERLKVGIRLAQAAELKDKGEKDKAYKEYRKLAGDYNWSVIGPFKNVAGSGYDIPFEVEKSPLRTDAEYLDETGMKLKWMQCKDRNPDGNIYFDYYLPSASSGVYYASTFLTAARTQLVQFRIARTQPLKIWLDDQLVFAGDKEISYRHDNEWVQLELPAGTHRVLLKYAENESASGRYGSMFGRSTALKSAAAYRNNDGGEYAVDDLSFDFSSLSKHLGSQELMVRITDTTGAQIQDISSAFSGAYQPHQYTATVTDRQLIRYFQNRINKSPDDLFAYYGLVQAYIESGRAEEGEEFFVKAYRAHKDIVLFKYVLSKIYQENGKKEKFYEVLHDIDPDKTPIFSMLYQKLGEKDKQNDEEEWLAALKKLYSVSPSNFSVIMEYVQYYDDKGMNQEKDDFINSVSESYASYKDALKPYLEKERKKNNGEGSSGGYSSRSSSKHYSYNSDYDDLEQIKQNGKTSKVIHRYDKLIASEPYNIHYRTEKAEYLKKKEKYSVALAELRKALEINPYSKDIYELMGDVYKEKDQKDSALYFYKKAKYFARNNSYSLTGLDDKIEKVDELKPLKKLFVTKKFEDVLTDQSWLQNYAGEESVVMLYTRDLVLDEFNHAQIFQKMMIKILTEAGVNKWTEFNFSFMGNINSAKVIKPNGAEVIPDMQGGLAVFKDLKPGDIIQMEGAYSWQPSGELDNELVLVSNFSFDAPVYYAKYEVGVPQGRYLGYRHHKLVDNTQKNTKDGYDFYKWEYNNIHKLEREDAILDDYDLYSTIMISTMKDWSKVVNWYKNKTYRKLEGSYEIKEVLDSIITPGMTQQAKVQAIYNYLTRDIKYSFVPFLQSGYTPKRCGLTLSSRIGDCKDVATVMIAMLRQVGVESYYTLVKTNYYDHQQYLPSQYFDHVIAGYYLDGKLHFADMTTDFYPDYVLTEADANAYALLIKDGETDIFHLPKDNLDPLKNKVEMTVDANLNVNRSVEVKVKALHPGTTGGDLRERFSRISQAEQKNYVMEKMGKGVFQNAEMKDYNFENLTDISSTLKSNYNIGASGFSDKVAGLLIFRVPFMTAIQTSQAMQSKTRYNRLNVDAICSVEPCLQKVDIHFPKGYQLIELPENFSIKSEFGEYKISFSRIKDGVHVEKYQAFTTSEVDVKDFEKFKDFYFKILDADMTRMAIQKKATAIAQAQ